MIPIEKDFIAECTLLNEASRKNFFEMYKKHSKARLKLKATCSENQILLAEYEGQYVAFK